MPHFTETKTPYEFLVRWDQDGKLAGAHVQFRETTYKDGVVIAQHIPPAEKVAILDGDDQGFSLPVIVGQIVVDQQKRIDELEANLGAAAAEIARLASLLEEATKIPTVQ